MCRKGAQVIIITGKGKRGTVGAKVSLEDYSVSNRSLRTGLMDLLQQALDKVAVFEEMGVDFLLLQSSPQLKEREHFSEVAYLKSIGNIK